jgi:hypothetical protein
MLICFLCTQVNMFLKHESKLGLNSKEDSAESILSHFLYITSLRIDLHDIFLLIFLFILHIILNFISNQEFDFI